MEIALKLHYTVKRPYFLIFPLAVSTTRSLRPLRIDYHRASYAREMITRVNYARASCHLFHQFLTKTLVPSALYYFTDYFLNKLVYFYTFYK